jgi:hypothetical protein
MSSRLKTISAQARDIYESRLRNDLERNSWRSYVAIEPESGDHFIGNSFDDAVNAALDKYPDRVTHTIRVGYAAAVHLGGLAR